MQENKQNATRIPVVPTVVSALLHINNCSMLYHRYQPQISITNPSKAEHPPKHFTFDAVYDETTQQKAFYEESCYDLVEGVMEGYNGTIFAYGQVH